MFERDSMHTDWMAIAGVSMALSIPMIFLMKNMSDSLQMIAHRVGSNN